MSSKTARTGEWMHADAAVQVRAAVHCGKLELAVFLPMTIAHGMRISHGRQRALICDSNWYQVG